MFFGQACEKGCFVVRAGGQKKKKEQAGKKQKAEKDYKLLSFFIKIIIPPILCSSIIGNSVRIPREKDLNPKKDNSKNTKRKGRKVTTIKDFHTNNITEKNKKSRTKLK